MDEKLMVNNVEEAKDWVVNSKPKGKTGLGIGGLAVAAGLAAVIGKKLVDKKKAKSEETDEVETEEDSNEESEE